jgi:ankyrin repeat protein
VLLIASQTGVPLLLLAVAYGRAAMVAALLASGADANGHRGPTSAPEGPTPLGAAIITGQAHTVALLRSHGADVTRGVLRAVRPG